tara:strand:+ start:206 stop:481 length:276 start_codon:yes stop_codon:yes gene_type:complete
MKKIYLIVSLAFLFTNLSYAEKVECHLLSPMQKAIYKAYCQAQEKKTEQSTSSKSSGKSLGLKEKTGSLMKKLKVNTDSKLFKTGKYSEKK